MIDELPSLWSIKLSRKKQQTNGVNTGLNTKLIETSSLFILFVILLASVFDFTNGFHDAGNSIATLWLLVF
ncbi:hypothetical protein FOLKNPGA_01688 [Legionella sp. PC1000]|nr:hypothetical protein FOLKNPGA_01688 [Legionella sp. PC1000]